MKKLKRKRVASADLGEARMFRMSRDLVERIGVYQDYMKDKHGIEADFSTAVRALIEQGLRATR